jgi:DNA polymerase-3 subunit delta'
VAFSIDSALGYLERSHREGRLGHAYLVTGGGTAARESLALRTIALVAGREPDGLDAAVELGVAVVRPASKSRRIRTADVRELEKRLHLGGAGVGGLRIAVMVEADRLQPEAANAFLKTLEEPPPSTLLLLLTGQPERLLATVLSRCIRVPLAGGEASAEKDEDELALLEMLDAHFRSPEGRDGQAGAALAFKGRFAALLAGVKERVTSAYEAEFADDVARYKKVTEGDWLERREEAL